MEDGKAEESNETQPVPSPLEYAFDAPRVLCTLNGSSSNGASHPDRTFWRQVAWSPDGSHLLAQSDDHHLDLFQLRCDAQHAGQLKYVLSVRAPTTLLAYAWYPFARCDEPATWCFVMSARDVPVRLVDAYEGNTRATYGIVDHVERFIGPQAVAFSLDGQRLYCAHDTSLSTFVLAHPGINTHTRMQLTPSHRATRKGKAAAGQRGTISCIAIASDRIAGSEHELVAIGTFAGTVGIYRTDNAATRGEEACVLGWKEEQGHGVAQISFHPTAPYILCVTSRRGLDVRAYDLRYVGTRRSFLHPPSDVALIGTFPRTSDECDDGPATQQRLYFDIDPRGRVLLAGDVNGHVRVWNIATAEGDDVSDVQQDSTSFGRILKRCEAPHRSAMHSWQGASDAVASVALHPYMPLVLLASGSRRWTVNDRESSASAESVEEETTRPSADGFCVRDGALRLYSIAPGEQSMATPPLG